MWCLVSYTPYSSTGEHVGGFAEPLDGSRWAGKINFDLNQFQPDIKSINVKWAKVESKNPETAKYDVFLPQSRTWKATHTMTLVLGYVATPKNV